ncbi:MAG: hypothetical protein IKM24_07715 [Clostridia bacterium]|nr:hypothetical protein [Clostridia bacterium]
MIVKGNVAYIGWDIFSAYAKHGHLCFKELFLHVLEKLIGNEKTVAVNLPDRGVVTLTTQAEENRRILHLLFAHTTVRGEHTEVIEDTVPLYDVACKVKCAATPTAVSLVPCGKMLAFDYADGYASFVVPEVNMHQMVELK